MSSARMLLAGKQLQQGIIVGGQFELERQLGAGGMGTVWAATDLRLGRSVAVKFLSSAFVLDEPARQRFEREARLAGRIRSPHVVQVFSQGLTDDGVPYVVMELLDGEDLSCRIARGGPCGLVEAASIVEQLCRALSRAHHAGLVHRDIKPHNVFLLPETGGTFVKLLDFGIAKDISTQLQSLTLTGSMLGTVMYCSPEQLRDPQSVGPLSDIWSLGVVIYQMLTGVTPFKGETLPEVVVRITEGEYVRATAVNAALPAAVDELFAQVLQTNPAHRLQSAEEVAEAIAKIVRANSSAVLQRTLPVGRTWSRPARSAARATGGARWAVGLLVAILAAAGVYYVTSRPDLQPTAAVPLADTSALGQAPVEHDTRAATAAAPIGSASAVTEGLEPEKAQSHAQQPAQPAPRQPQSRQPSRARAEPRDSTAPPPSASAPAAAPPAAEPKPKATPRRDFGF